MVFFSFLDISPWEPKLKIGSLGIFREFTILELKSGLFMAILRPHLITIYAAAAAAVAFPITNVLE